jgi:hypothetical protein
MTQVTSMILINLNSIKGILSKNKKFSESILYNMKKDTWHTGKMKKEHTTVPFPSFFSNALYSIGGRDNKWDNSCKSTSFCTDLLVANPRSHIA